ncbi:hypothetical protein FJ471_09385 [Mesorhizobium sp. B2-7-1]|nr:hypothetical protein FJ471_09385 [Mesorhizobium sp. B2-7-1]
MTAECLGGASFSSGLGIGASSGSRSGSGSRTGFGSGMGGGVGTGVGTGSGLGRMAIGFPSARCLGKACSTQQARCPARPDMMEVIAHSGASPGAISGASWQNGRARGWFQPDRAGRAMATRNDQIIPRTCFGSCRRRWPP